MQQQQQLVQQRPGCLAVSFLLVLAGNKDLSSSSSCSAVRPVRALEPSPGPGWTPLLLFAFITEIPPVFVPLFFPTGLVWESADFAFGFVFSPPLLLAPLFLSLVFLQF